MFNPKEKYWYHDLHRFGQTNLTEDDPVKCDIEFWKDYWKRAKVQGVIINCGGIVAYYQSKFPMQYRAALLQDRDLFGEFNQAARDAGLYVIARMDINCAYRDFYEQYPDWFAKDKYGEPIMTQGRYVSCVNSGYYKEYIPAVLEEIIEKYHPNGFADNSWKGLGRNTICYCDNCKHKFKSEYGHDLPEEVSWDDPIYRTWIRWSYVCRTENWDLFNATTKKAGGDDCLWFGMINADPFHSVGSFTDIKALCERSSIIFCDHQSRDILNGFEQNTSNGNLLRMASEEDIIVLESMAHYLKGNRTFRLSSGPAKETQTWMLCGIAGGISPWYHHIGGSTNDRRQFHATIPVMNWHEQNEEYLYHRKSMANVAIVWSQNNVDFYGRDDYVEKTAYPWSGFCRAMSRAGIPFLPIHADDIEKYSDRIDTLILPELAIMTDTQQQSICRYLNSGKNLIITGKTATLDEDGDRAVDSPIYQMLGLRHTGKTIGAFGNQEGDWLNHEAHNYIRLPIERHEIFEALSDTDILPFGGGIQLVESTGVLEPLCSYIPAFPIYPPEFAWIREEREDIVPIYAGTLKSGARVIYYAADIDRCYGKELLPDHAALLAAGIRWASNKSLPIIIHGYGHINCSIYQQGDNYILHLVNLSGCDNRPGTCNETLPVGPVVVEFNHPLCMARRARLTVADQILSVIGGQLTIDRIYDHEMIILEPVL